MQYVYSKTDDPPRVTQYTVQELCFRKHKNCKKPLKINDGTLGKRRCSPFPTQRINNKSTAEQISANLEHRGPIQIRHKTMPQEGSFLTTSSRRNRFLLVES